jgi:hypothetical protein
MMQVANRIDTRKPYSIRNAPEYTESEGITREYEDSLCLHYGKPPYWIDDAERRTLLSMDGVYA